MDSPLFNLPVHVRAKLQIDDGGGQVANLFFVCKTSRRKKASRHQFGGSPKAKDSYSNSAAFKQHHYNNSLAFERFVRTNNQASERLT